MIAWLLLVLLFFQDGIGQEHGVLRCGPQNLTLTSSDRRILLTWDDEPSCSAVRDILIYELGVFIADEQVLYEEVAVTPDQIGSIHSWNWTSDLSLQCASVRLRSRHKNHKSPWKQEQTLPGIKKPERPEVFPRDRVFKVGSRVTFCCYLPQGQTFKKMHLPGYDDSTMYTTRISNRMYGLTVQLNQPSKDSGTDVKCETNAFDNGACVYVGYPPDDMGLECETRNLQSVECHWNVTKRNTRLYKRSPAVYQLLGSQCPDGSQGICKMDMQVDAGERSWTLTAQNDFGKVELSERADLTKRVHMFAPKGVMASTVNTRNVTLEWGWTVQQYNNLNIKCQVNLCNDETNITSENFGVGLHFAVLNDLIPFTKYNVTVRCGTMQHFWKWSDWSTIVTFITKGDVPDALDVWMKLERNTTIIIWKIPLANQSHGHITDYEVTWAKTTEREQQNREKVHNKDRLALSRDTTEEYIVTVTARNINGSSSPSTITIPSLNPASTESPDRTKEVSQIIGSKGTFNLSWSSDPAASCGYIVDWCPTLRDHEVGWLKVPPNETKASVFSKFEDEVRYSLSVYACTQGAPVLLQRREGYVSEKRIKDDLFKPLKFKQQGSDVEVFWDPIDLRNQPAFIQGYVLSCSDKNNKVFNFSTDDPRAIKLTATNLNMGSYTFEMRAKTAVGECGTTKTTATLNSPETSVSVVLISLVAVFSLLSLITILCYRHWTNIKQKVYPPIPRPVLIDKWLTSPGENSCRSLYMERWHQSEADNVDVLELNCNSVALQNAFVSKENMLSVFAQTPKDFYNLPPSPPLTVRTTTIPSQSGLPSSPFRTLFSNLTYLVTEPGYQQSDSGPRLQEGTPLERSSGGYQPQRDIETFTVNQTTECPESPMSCDSTYILLPQSQD